MIKKAYKLCNKHFETLDGKNWCDSDDRENPRKMFSLRGNHSEPFFARSSGLQRSKAKRENHSLAAQLSRSHLPATIYVKYVNFFQDICQPLAHFFISPLHLNVSLFPFARKVFPVYRLNPETFFVAYGKITGTFNLYFF